MGSLSPQTVDCVYICIYIYLNKNCESLLFNIATTCIKFGQYNLKVSDSIVQQH